MESMIKDKVCEAIKECATMYSFDSEEAIRKLNMDSLKIQVSSKKSKASLKPKSLFPLPFNGEAKEDCCQALRKNGGLFTQCLQKRKDESQFCKSCELQANKNSTGKPDHGTIQDRMACGLYEFRTPKGEYPIPFAKLMKKKNISQEDVFAEAGKFNIVIDPIHFQFLGENADKKKGRPKANSEQTTEDAGEKKKGRPKKSKKVVDIGDDNEDLFATLVAQSCDEEEDVKPFDKASEKEAKLQADKAEKEAKLQAEKAEKEAKLQADKAEKEAKKLADKAEKEAKKLADKAEKEAKLQAEKAEKEAKLQAEKAEKEAKLQAEKAEKEAKKLAEKAEKEAKKLAEKAEKEANKHTKKESDKTTTPLHLDNIQTAKPETKQQEQPDVVKKFEYQGTKYLKSKKTGIVYNMEQEQIGKWNEDSKKIDFFQEDGEEEEEEEYEEEEE
jgi:hypothetical protein